MGSETDGRAPKLSQKGGETQYEPKGNGVRSNIEHILLEMTECSFIENAQVCFLTSPRMKMSKLLLCFGFIGQGIE